jgi:hypothetical protein
LPQAIGEISEEDAQKEGFSDEEESKQTWINLYGKWNPKEIVRVYDFVLDKQDSSSKDNIAGPGAKQSKSR